MHRVLRSFLVVSFLIALLLLLPATLLFAQEGDGPQPSDDASADAAADSADSSTDTPPTDPPPTEAPPAADTASPADVWSHFTPHIELRLKPEWITTNNGTAQDADFNTFLRARLGLTWKPDDKVSATVILQDVHKFEVWASGGGTVGGTGTTGLTFNADVYLAFLKWKIVDGVMLQAGRQEISYDDQRMLGALNWVDAGRQFDAFRLRLGDSGHTHTEFSLDLFWTPLRFFGASPIVGGGSPAGRFAKHTRQLMGVHATLPFIEDHKLSAYLIYLNNRASAGVPDHLFTIGAFFKSTAKEGLIYDAEVAIQVSKTNAVDDLGFAWAEHVGFGFIMGDFTIAAEANAASGDDGGTTVESFNNLFPTNHNKYGYIDRQSWSNTLNFAVRGYYSLKMDEESAPWIAELSVWVFFPLRYTGANDSFAGTFATGSRGMKAFEIDSLIRHKFTKELSAAFGASLWVPGAALRAGGTKGTDLYLYALIGVKY